MAAVESFAPDRDGALVGYAWLRIRAALGS
jgi:hypothetical protein